MSEDAYGRLAPAILAALPLGVVVWRLESLDDESSLRLVGFNAAATAITGVDLSRCVGKMIGEVVPEAASRYAIYAEVVRTGRPTFIEEVTSDRNPVAARRFSVSVVPLADRCVGLFFENQKRVEDEVRELNVFLNSIIENIPTTIFLKDAEHLRFERFNRAGEKLLGVPRDTLIGKDDFDLLPREQAEISRSKDRAVLARGVLDVTDEPLETPRGTRWLYTKKLPIGNRGGKPTHLLGISLDITERREAELALRRARDELEARVLERTIALERSNQELQEFAMVASHDLQEPMRKIAVFGEKLQAEHAKALGPIGQDYLRRMLNASARGQSLINDLLAYARVSTSAKPRVPVDLKTVADEVASDLEGRLAQIGGTIVIGPLPVIEADPMQMRQLFQNLIGNALKFQRSEGSPMIRVHTVPSAKEVTIAFEDNGIGFDEKYAERIFKVFQRLHERTAYEGSGIGLSICRKIVERHRGTISAKSTPGQGSTFFVRLPPSS